MSYIAIPTRTEADLNSSADINQLMANIEYLKERIENYPLEVLYPVGARYIQFPEPDGSWNPAEAPGNKFGGIWVLRFATEGTFFRTEGDPVGEGQNQKRTNGLQNFQLQGFTVTIQTSRYDTAGGQTGSRLAGNNQSNPWPSEADITYQQIITNPAYGTLSIGKETRPINRLMRIYERIE